MTGNPTTLIDPTQLPVDPATCKPVYPHSVPEGEHDLRGRARGRAAHRLVRQAPRLRDPQRALRHGRPGPLHARDQQRRARPPARPTTGPPTTRSPSSTTATRCRPCSTRSTASTTAAPHHVGTPAIFGMNFQTVSTAEKLPTSDGLTGGYLADGVTPGPLLSRALDYIDAPDRHDCSTSSRARDLTDSTVDHPVRQARPVAADPVGADPDPRRPDHRRAQRGLGSGAPRRHAALVAFAIDDDGMLIWLNDRSAAADAFAKTFLLAPLRHRQRHQRQPEAVHRAPGCAQVYAGPDAAALLRRAGRRRAGAGRARRRPGRRRLHRQAGQDRRARRRQPAGPRRPAGRLRRPHRAPRRRWLGRSRRRRSPRRSCSSSASTPTPCRPSRSSTRGPCHCPDHT